MAVRDVAAVRPTTGRALLVRRGVVKAAGPNVSPSDRSPNGRFPEFVHWVDPKREVHPTGITRWFEATGGVPVLLEQLIRGHEAAFRGGNRAEDERRLSLEPRALLRGSDEPELKLLTLAAVASRDVSFPLLIKATGQDEESLAEEVERLVDLGILREKPGEVFEFIREDVRIRALLPTHRPPASSAAPTRGGGDRSDRHRRPRDDLLPRTPLLSRDASDAQAVDFNRRAAEFARRAHTSNVALVHYEQALEAHRRAFPEDLAGELDLVLQIALERDRVGELKRAEQLLRETLTRPTVLTAATPDQRALFGLLLGGSWPTRADGMRPTTRCRTPGPASMRPATRCSRSTGFGPGARSCSTAPSTARP